MTEFSAVRYLQARHVAGLAKHRYCIFHVTVPQRTEGCHIIPHWVEPLVGTMMHAVPKYGTGKGWVTVSRAADVSELRVNLMMCIPYRDFAP